ncbi:hypothetical protein ACFL6C_06905 [Myxococcota bacterium]
MTSHTLRGPVFDELNGMGANLARFFGNFDVIRSWIERGASYNFEGADLVAEHGSRAGLGLIGQLTTDLVTPRNVPLEPADLERFQEYVRMVVERYDGDAELGVEVGHPLFPDCDANGDGAVTEQESLAWAQTHRFHVWEVLKEPVPPPTNPLPGAAYFSAAEAAAILRAGWEAIREADPGAVVLFGGLATGHLGLDRATDYLRSILLEGGDNRFDVLGVGLFGNEPADVAVAAYRGVLDEYELTAPVWVVQIGTNGGGCGSNSYGGSLEKQAQYVVKSHALSYAGGADRVFWGDFVSWTDQWVDCGSSELGAMWGNYGLLIAQTIESGETISRRPAAYTYALMTAKLEGFTSVEHLDIAGGPTAELFRFTFAERSPVWVLWSSQDSGEADLSMFFESSTVTVTPAVVDTEQTEPAPTVQPVTSIPLDLGPVFIE